jgi:dienelactone hydrolase
MFETARIEHRTLDRMAKMDAKRPGTPAKVAPAAAPVNDLRATIEKAAAKRGATKEQPVAVGSALGATIAFAAGRKAELATTYAEKDTQRMADGIDPKPDNSLRGDIERAMAMDAEQDDTEETEGGADE